MSVAAVEEESKAFVFVYGSDVDDSFPNEMMHFIEFIGKEKTNAQQAAVLSLHSVIKVSIILKNVSIRNVSLPCSGVD